MPQPIYMSYWVGMTPKLCGVENRNLIANGTLTKQVISSLVLKNPRGAIDTVVESCYYIISVDTSIWKDGNILISLEASNNANMNVYIGKSRRNSTKATELDKNVVIGAPIKV